MPKTSLPAGITIETIEAFWREAASATYASDKDPIKNEDGSKTHRFEDSEHGLWYEDTWRSVNGYGFGTTLIGHVETGVLWFMQYRGFKKTNAKTPLLLALNKGLQSDVFCGCRGPESFSHDGFAYYENIVGGTFSEFAGVENIYFGSDDESQHVHQHEYEGRLLVVQN